MRNRRDDERSPVRVLVVDDNEVFAETIAWLLGQHERIEVIGCAPNGLYAIGLAASAEPDVVLMDLDMPVMGGIEATRVITSLGSARVVILTASAGSDGADQAAEAGAILVLRKDQPLDDVTSAVLAAAA